MNHVVKHCPDEGLNKLEEISYLQKLNDKNLEAQYLKTCVKKSYAAPADEKTTQVTSVIAASTKPLFAKKEVGEDGPTAVGLIPDLTAQARVW
jgi:hypothetical protein